MFRVGRRRAAGTQLRPRLKGHSARGRWPNLFFEFKAWLENRSDPALAQLTYRDQKTKYRRLELPVYSLSATGDRKRSPERSPLSRLRTLGVDHECSALSILGPELIHRGPILFEVRKVGIDLPTGPGSGVLPSGGC